MAFAATNSQERAFFKHFPRVDGCEGLQKPSSHRPTYFPGGNLQPLPQETHINDLGNRDCHGYCECRTDDMKRHQRSGGGNLRIRNRTDDAHETQLLRKCARVNQSGPDPFQGAHRSVGVGRYHDRSRCMLYSLLV